MKRRYRTSTKPSADRRAFLAACLLLAATGCSRGGQPSTEHVPMNAAIQQTADSEPSALSTDPKPSDPDKLETATFGAGCFWCVEAVFQRLKGVRSVVSGYAGGKVANPTYEQVCTGKTGHAEVCQIQYDPRQVSFEQLLEVFWKTHDPTTLNRQGADVGTQYRSVIFYDSEKQKALAEEYKKRLDASGVFGAPIVTEISPLTDFYRAEDYHQNYYRANPNQGYCRMVIAPKVEKFEKVFAEKLKGEQP